MKIYIVCPIRKATPKQTSEVVTYVSQMEQAGHKVHWPARDTVQENDNNGMLVCLENRKAIQDADEVHVYWDPTSQGSVFDLGMAWAWAKPIRLINPLAVPPGKSLEKVLFLWSGGIAFLEHLGRGVRTW